MAKLLLLKLESFNFRLKCWWPFFRHTADSQYTTMQLVTDRILELTAHSTH